MSKELVILFLKTKFTFIQSYLYIKLKNVDIGFLFYKFLTSLRTFPFVPDLLATMYMFAY